jgi:hypothetical protein
MELFFRTASSTAPATRSVGRPDFSQMFPACSLAARLLELELRKPPQTIPEMITPGQMGVEPIPYLLTSARNASPEPAASDPGEQQAGVPGIAHRPIPEEVFTIWPYPLSTMNGRNDSMSKIHTSLGDLGGKGCLPMRKNTLCFKIK